MITFQQNGGLLLGAYLNDELVGFSLSFIGLTADGRVKLCSEQLGILPQHQSLNIGYQLKLAQRDEMISRGINHITWTYDPLETKNGNLNLHKLGAMCNTYLLNVYGEAEGINAGIATDRFQVDWWLDNPHTSQRLKGENLNELDAIIAEGEVFLNSMTDDEFPRPQTTETPLLNNRLLLQVPTNIQKMKQFDLPLAQLWRQHTRDIFTAVFQQGYLATDLIFANSRCYYLLERQSDG
jgi:predicted GNAT superfamily acetyltransferase